jgi:HIV Tat-specific factor 1
MYGLGEPKIKIYRDEEGQAKGDALVTYYRPESVSLAIQLLDGTELRLGSGKLINVEEASIM